MHLKHLNFQSSKFLLGGYVGYDLAAIHSKPRKTRLNMFSLFAYEMPIFAIVDLLYFAHHDHLLERLVLNVYLLLHAQEAVQAFS